MKREDEYSEEQLNAFVDGELDSNEKSRLLSESARSGELDHRLCQQRKLKELVKHAYEDIPRPSRARGSQGSSYSLLGRSLVAGVLVLIGLGIGFVTHQQLDRATGFGQQAAVPVAADNYLLHVTSGSVGAMKAALEQARMLSEEDVSGRHQVEIVANEEGLNLLRSDVTPFAGEISALADHDVVFYACSRAIERLEQRGVKVVLVPEANPEYTALDRVVLRMREGWRYLKI
jgi:intracellular sulfur oxidation DsrE/DsrF family protein